jgi:hypothetical protein
MTRIQVLLLVCVPVIIFSAIVAVVFKDLGMWSLLISLPISATWGAFLALRGYHLK